ncbi:hypothetical protein ACS0TY_003011 [Phlomoides rotata]
MEIDGANQTPLKRHAVESSSDPNKPSFENLTYDGVIVGKVLGRSWKEVQTNRASAVHVSKNRPTEQRMKEKKIKKAYRERIMSLRVLCHLRCTFQSIYSGRLIIGGGYSDEVSAQPVKWHRAINISQT